MQCLDNLERLSQFSSRELQDALEADVEEWKKQPRQAAQVWRQLAQRKQIPKSLQILRFLQQHGVEAADAITFNIAIAASSKVSTWQSACEFLELMKECRVQATTVTCNTVLNVYERASKWHLALQLPEEIKAVAMGPDGIMMNACTSNVARMRKWQHAMLMLEEVSDDYENIAFNSALSSMETSMWFAGQDFLQRMHSSKIQADRYTYSTLLKISPWRHALLGMAQAEVDCDDRDAVITGALLAACESSWYVSLHILREAQASRAADNVAFNSGINAAEKSTWECALLLLGTMRASEVRTDSYSFSSAMGPWKLSVRLLSQMQEDGASPNLVCLNSVANALERSGDWKAGLELLKRNLFHPDTTTFNILLNACGRASAWQMAIEILKLAQKNMAHDAITFRSAISACEGGNCWKEVR